MQVLLENGRIGTDARTYIQRQAYAHSEMHASLRPFTRPRNIFNRGRYAAPPGPPGAPPEEYTVSDRANAPRGAIDVEIISKWLLYRTGVR